ncbi:MAG: hypothetical protein ACI9XP_002073, partial [Lentimonas sp.]
DMTMDECMKMCEAKGCTAEEMEACKAMFGADGKLKEGATCAHASKAECAGEEKACCKDKK